MRDTSDFMNCIVKRKLFNMTLDMKELHFLKCFLREFYFGRRAKIEQKVCSRVTFHDDDDDVSGLLLVLLVADG